MQIYLYKLRKEAGMTQKEMAQNLDITASSYRRKEQGKNAFTQDEMFIISRLFSKPMQEIFLPRK